MDAHGDLRHRRVRPGRDRISGLGLGLGPGVHVGRVDPLDLTGRLVHALGQNTHRRSGLLQTGGLLLGAAGKVVEGLRNFVSSTADTND
jgi:hypothetical protein